MRVVDIEGFDVTPCGGTHCTHTAQIELVWVQGVERYKGGTRITFAAGPRARRLLVEESDALRRVAAELKCAPPEVSDIVDKLRGKLDAAREEAGALRAGLASSWAARLARAAGPIVEVVEGADATLLRAIAERLAEGDRVVALAAPEPEGVHVVIARGPDSSVSAGAVLKALAQAAGGRGGGRPQLAQGRLPAGIEFVSLAREALSAH